MESSLAIWKASWPVSGSASVTSPASLETNSGSSSIAVFGSDFLRVHCRDCGLDRLVPYSCKRRSICSSCGGRRMADTAAHLVDRVFPRVPVRQWVLTVPYALRYRLAYDASLVTDVLAVLTRTVFGSLIRRAREFGAERKPQCGAVSFIQRFDSALRLNLHIHMLAFDGIYAADENNHPQFQALFAPDNDEIARLTATLAQRMTRLLDRRGLGPDSDAEESDSLPRDEPWLAGLYAAAVTGQNGLWPQRRTPCDSGWGSDRPGEHGFDAQSTLRHCRWIQPACKRGSACRR